MNWGYKIAILYGGFVVVVLASVFFAMTQKVDLVTDNYYEKELKYQEQINKSQRTKALKEKTNIEVSLSGIKLKFPVLPDKNTPNDYILLYRPSDPSKDIKLNISTDSFGFQYIPAEKISKGFWKVKLSWTSGGFEYYDESIVNIP
jgi:hypothetical protein